MKAYLATLLFVSAAALAAQPLTLVRLPEETPVSTRLDVGSTAPSDILDTRMRLRNTGATALTLSALRIEGAGFTLEGAPTTNAIMAPGVNADFRIRFRPAAPGNYSATLRANDITVLVTAAATPGIALYRDGVLLTSDRAIEFPTITTGQRARIGLVLRNEATQDLPIRQLSVTGAAFSLAPSPLPAFLRAGEEAPFELFCQPTRAGLATGSLQLDARTFSLAALARDPEAPPVLLELDPNAARSGQQSALHIRLATIATNAVSGTLRLEFTPSVDARPGDAAIQFLGNSTRNLPIQITPGQTKVDAAFQTGTTAGMAVFVLTLGSQEREIRVTIPPEAPMIDTVQMQKAQGSVEVTITGFDNHRSAGNVVFTFTDLAGVELPAVSAEAAAAFKQHFAESPQGGLFRLTARFPVNGDGSRLARVAVRLANGIGASGGRSE